MLRHCPVCPCLPSSPSKGMGARGLRSRPGASHHPRRPAACGSRPTAAAARRAGGIGALGCLGQAAPNCAWGASGERRQRRLVLVWFWLWGGVEERKWGRRAGRLTVHISAGGCKDQVQDPGLCLLTPCAWLRKASRQPASRQPLLHPSSPSPGSPRPPFSSMPCQQLLRSVGRARVSPRAPPTLNPCGQVPHGGCGCTPHGQGGREAPEGLTRGPALPA